MVWKYIICSKRVFLPKAIDLALLLQSEKKNWHGIVQIFALTTYGKQVGPVLLSREAARGNTCHVLPQHLDCCQPGPGFQGKARIALCPNLMALTHRNRAMATVCHGVLLSRAGVWALHLPRALRAALCRLTSLVPPQGSHTPLKLSWALQI